MEEDEMDDEMDNIYKSQELEENYANAADAIARLQWNRINEIGLSSWMHKSGSKRTVTLLIKYFSMPDIEEYEKCAYLQKELKNIAQSYKFKERPLSGGFYDWVEADEAENEE
jgi:hypothetical protein